MGFKNYNGVLKGFVRLEFSIRILEGFYLMILMGLTGVLKGFVVFGRLWKAWALGAAA